MSKQNRTLGQALGEVIPPMSQRAKRAIYEALITDLDDDIIPHFVTGSRAVNKASETSDYDIWVPNTKPETLCRILEEWGAVTPEGYASAESGQAYSISNAVHLIVVPLASVELRHEVEAYVSEHAELFYMLPKETRRTVWRQIWDAVKAKRAQALAHDEEMDRR